MYIQEKAKSSLETKSPPTRSSTGGNMFLNKKTGKSPKFSEIVGIFV